MLSMINVSIRFSKHKELKGRSTIPPYPRLHHRTNLEDVELIPVLF